MNRQVLRLIGIIAIAFWVASLFAVANNSDGFKETGLLILAEGWLSPVMEFLAAFSNPLALIGCFAWYANIILLINVLTLIRGIKPQFETAIIGFFIALSGLAPFYYIAENNGKISGVVYYRGPAVWLWLSAFAIVLATAFYTKQKKPAVSTKSISDEI